MIQVRGYSLSWGEIWGKPTGAPHRGVQVPARRLANWSTAFFCIVGVTWL